MSRRLYLIPRNHRWHGLRCPARHYQTRSARSHVLVELVPHGHLWCNRSLDDTIQAARWYCESLLKVSQQHSERFMDRCIRLWHARLLARFWSALGST